MILTRSFEVLPKRGLSKVSLRAHEARGWISKLSRYAHHRRRAVAGALCKIGRNRNRANKDEGGQHRKFLFQRVEKLTAAIGFAAGSASIILGRGVRTAT
jgi:hypothetical protein